MQEDNSIIFDKKGFQNLAPALQRQLFRQAIQELLGTLKDIETRHIEELMEALNKPAGRQISLPEGLIFSINYNQYTLGPQPGGLTPFPEIHGEYDIPLPGQTEVCGWKVEADIVTPNEFPDYRGDRETGENDGFTGYFDYEKVGNALKLGLGVREICFSLWEWSFPKRWVNL